MFESALKASASFPKCANPVPCSKTYTHTAFACTDVAYLVLILLRVLISPHTHKKRSSRRSVYNRDPSSPSARGKKSQVERHQGGIAPLCASHGTARLSVRRHAGCVRVGLQRRKRSLFLQDEMRACRGREEEEEEGERGAHERSLLSPNRKSYFIFTISTDISECVPLNSYN